MKRKTTEYGVALSTLKASSLSPSDGFPPARNHLQKDHNVINSAINCEETTQIPHVSGDFFIQTTVSSNPSLYFSDSNKGSSQPSHKNGCISFH